MKKWQKILLITVTASLIIFIWTRPCLLYGIWEKHSCECIGFSMGYGEQPTQDQMKRWRINCPAKEEHLK